MQIIMDKTLVWMILGCILSMLPRLGTEFKYKDDSFSLFHITAPTPEIAKEIARILIEKKLAARVMIVRNFASMYDSKTQQFYYQEAWMIVTARTEYNQKIRKAVGLKNPIASLDVSGVPIRNGNPTYLEWMSTSFVSIERKQPIKMKNQIEQPVKPEEYIQEIPAPAEEPEAAPAVPAPENIEMQEQPKEYGEQPKEYGEQPKEYGEQNAEDYEPAPPAVNPEEEMAKQAKHHHHHHRHRMQQAYGK